MALLKKKRNFQSNNIGKQMYKYHLFNWGLSLILTVLPAFFDAYGDTGGWCWITRQNTGWRMVQFYIPLWLVVGYCTYVYINVYRRLKESRDVGSAKLMTRIMYYPLVLVVCFLPASINRVVEVFLMPQLNSDNPSQRLNTYIFIMTLLHVFFTSLFGVSNAIVYGLTPVVRERVREKLCCGDDGSTLVEDEEPDEGEITNRISSV
jgi:hypothetical protein